MKPSRIRLIAPCSSICCVALLPFIPVMGGTINEFNGGSSSLSSASNWSLGAAPTSSASAGSYTDLLFTGSNLTLLASGGTNTNFIAESYNVTNGNSYTLQISSSNTASFRAGSTGSGSEVLAPFNNAVSGIDQDLIYLTNGSSLEFIATNGGAGSAAPMSLRQAGNFNIGAGSVLTINPVISQLTSLSSGLNINGSGTTIFNAANTYTGLTTINGGTLRYGVNDALSSGGVTVAGGTLDLQSYTDTVGAVIVSSGSIIGSGTLTGTSYSITGASTISAKLAGASGVAITAASGTVNLNGANSYAGATTVASGGTLKLGNATALGTTAAGTTISSGGVLDLNGQAVVGETLGLSGTGISSGGALINSGGAASFSGTVTLNGNTSIGGAGNISLGDVGQSGTRSLTKVGEGTLTFGGTNSYTGGTTISEGTIEITGGNSAGGLFTLSLGTGLTESPVLKLSSANALSTTATLTGSNSFLTAGTVDLAVAGAHTLGAFNGNNLKFTASSGNATTLNFTQNSTLTSGTATTRTLTNTDANLSIVFEGSFDIGSSNNGNPIITGSGDTTIQGDILSTGDGVRGLTKNGSGTLTMNGTGFYTGTTNVNAGTLVINGNISTSSLTTVSGSGTISGSGTTGNLTVASGGTLSPGNSPGKLETGNEIWQNGGNYNWQMLDATGAAGTGYDTIDVTGTLDLSSLTAGGFAINLWSLASIAPDVNGDALNFDNSLTQSWTILTTTGGIIGFDDEDFTIATGISNNTGGFSNALNGGFTLGQSGDSKNLILTYTAIPEPTVIVLGGIGMLGLLRRRRNG